MNKNIVRIGILIFLLTNFFILTSCGNDTSDTEINPPHEHIFVEYEVIREPTCTTVGVMRYKCTECGITIDKWMDMCSHEYEITIEEPTCTKTGKKIKICKNCEYVLESVIQKTDHNFVNNVCQGCYIITGNTEPSEGLRYRINESQDGVVLIGVGTCKHMDIVIPSEYKGLPVTRISSYAFENNEIITSVVIPDTVKEIEASAFKSCENLEKVVIGKNVKIIRSDAFIYCDNLKEVIFEENSELLNIGTNVFYCCSNLEKINLPKKLVSISDYAFFRCSKLSSIYIADSVETIGISAFDGCESLKEVIFGENSQLELIDDLAFSSCKSLTKIIIPKMVEEIGQSAYSWCENIEEIIFEKNSQLIIIEDLAFSSCKKIKEIKFPSNLEVIGGDIFDGCSQLTNIEIDSKVNKIGNLGNFVNLKTMYYEGNLENWLYITIDTKYTSLFWSVEHFYLLNDNNEYQELTEVVIPEKFREISKSAFAGMECITKVTIHSNITAIREAAFNGCTNLKEVIFEENSQLTNIGSYAFAYCESLPSIFIGKGVKKIEDNCFAECSNLTIYCEISEYPVTWNGIWNVSDCPVIWGYTKE